MTKLAEQSLNNSSLREDDSEETQVKKFVKSMLKGCQFVGTFEALQFVEPLNDYRAVVHVFNDDLKFINYLAAVKKRLTKFYGTSVWIGITDPRTIGAPAGYNLWVNLTEKVFGTYSFKVKNVVFHKNEIALKLERIETLQQSSSQNDLHESSEPKNTDIADGKKHNLILFDTYEMSCYIKSKLQILFTDVINFSNLKESIIFISLLLSTMLTFVVQAAKYLLEFGLKFMHEFSGFIHACTPICLGILRVISNIIMGFYTLLAYMWRTRKDTPNFVQQSYAMPLNYENARAIRYDEEWHNNSGRKRNRRPNRSSVTITPYE